MGEAVAGGEDVEDLCQRGDECQADAERVELTQRSGARHDERHADERDGQRQPLNATQPLTEPDRRHHRDAGGVEVEDEQGQCDRDALERHEGSEVEDRVRDGGGEHEPPVAHRNRTERPGRTPAAKNLMPMKTDTTAAPSHARQVTSVSDSTPASPANRLSGPSVAKHTAATTMSPAPVRLSPRLTDARRRHRPRPAHRPRRAPSRGAAPRFPAWR